MSALRDTSAYFIRTIVLVSVPSMVRSSILVLFVESICIKILSIENSTVKPLTYGKSTESNGVVNKLLSGKILTIKSP